LLSLIEAAKGATALTPKSSPPLRTTLEEEIKEQDPIILDNLSPFQPPPSLNLNQ